MTYDDLIIVLTRETGLHSEVVKNVLAHLPEALMTLSLTDTVRTPLGVFRAGHRKARNIQLPNGTISTVIPRKVVKLTSGTRLQSKDQAKTTG